MAQPDFYALLGVARNASAADLKQAYRRLAVAWHPDRNPGSRLAESRFKAVSEAYAVLSDPIKRRKYDMLGPEDFKHEFSKEDVFKGFDIADLFRQFGLDDATDALAKLFDGNIAVHQNNQENAKARISDFFAGFGQKAGTAHDRRAPDIMVPLILSFKEAALGCEKFAAYNTAKGAVKVKVSIPPGSREGQRIVLKSQGPALAGTNAGDLIVTLSVNPDPNFTLRGCDLHFALVLSKKELTEGCRPVVKNLEGQALRLTIPPGVSLGARFKISGHGLPKSGGGGKGDLIITLK